MARSKKMNLLDELAFHVIHIKNKVLCNSQGLVVLQLCVDVVHFPLSVFPQPFLLCLRQRCGLHSASLLHRQKNYEQLRSRRPRCWETRD